MFRYLFGSSTTFLTMSISLISLQISKLSRIVMVGRTRCQIWRSKGQLKSPVLDKFLSWHRIKLTALYNSSTLMSPNSLFTIVNRMFKTECSMTLSIFKSGTFFEEIRSWKIKSKQNSDFDKIAGKFENPHFSSRFFFTTSSPCSPYTRKRMKTLVTLLKTPAKHLTIEKIGPLHLCWSFDWRTLELVLPRHLVASKSFEKNDSGSKSV